MKFLHPEFLYFMTIPLIILFALLLTQKEASGSFFSDEVMDRLRVAANTLTLKARNALFFLAGFFMIVALSEPVIPNGKITVAKKSADILIALDISNSMLAQDVYPSRIVAAKQKALQLLQKIKEDRVGVIAFAKSAYLVSPLSFDIQAVAFLLQNLDTNSITQQGTNILALLETVHKSSTKTKKKYVVIFTDGGDKKDYSKEIAYAKEHEITVFIEAFGTQKGAPIVLENGEFLSYNNKIVITKRNQAIAKLALATGGVYVEATTSTKDIELLAKELASIVAKKELKTKAIEQYIPLFYLPLGAAMLLILVALSSMSKREEVKVESFIWIVGLSFLLGGDLKAGILDFRDLEQAKEAFEKKEYRASAKAFEAYARSQNTPEAYYNAANAYYKAGDYHTALGMYEKVHNASASLRAKTYANMGNTYAQLGQYQKALEAYNEALKIEYDKEVEENKQRVEKLLQQKKQQQQNNQQNQHSQNPKQNQQQNQQQQESNQQSQQQQNNQQHQDSSQQNKDSQTSQQNQQQQESNQQSQQQQNNQQHQDSSQQNKDSQTSQQNQQQQESNQQSQQEGKKQKKKEQKKSQPMNSTQENNQSLKQLSQMMPPLEHQEEKMSDAEEKKWLEYLNQNQKTFLYKMPSKEQVQRGYEDEKPW